MELTLYTTTVVRRKERLLALGIKVTLIAAYQTKEAKCNTPDKSNWRLSNTALSCHASNMA